MKRLSRPMALLLAVLMVICSCMTALADQETYTLGDYDMDAFTAGRAAALAMSIPSVPTGGLKIALDGNYSSLTETLYIEDNEIDDSKDRVTVSDKDDFRLTISWNVADGITANDVYTYAYPDELVLDGSFQNGGEVRANLGAGEVQVGYWTISDGKLAVWFNNETFLNYTDRGVMINLSGTVDTSKLDPTENDNVKKVDLQTKDPLVNVITDSGLTISKNGSITVDSDNKIKGSYTITVTAEKNLTNVKITDEIDYIAENEDYYSDYWSDSNYDYSGSGSVTKPSGSNGAYVISEMLQGESIVITYNVDIAPESYNYHSYSNLSNTAKAVSDQTTEKSATCQLNINWPEISKTGEFNESENAVYWTIIVENNDFYSTTIREFSNSQQSNSLDNVSSTEVVSVTKKSSSSAEESIEGVTFEQLCNENGYTLNGNPGDVFTIVLKSTLQDASVQGSVTNYVKMLSPIEREVNTTVQIQRSDLNYTATKSGKLLPWTDHSSPVRTVEWTIDMEFEGSPYLNFPYEEGTELKYNTGAMQDALSNFSLRKMTLDRDSIKLLDENLEDVTSQYLEIQEAQENLRGFSELIQSFMHGYGVYFRFKKDAPEGKYTLKYQVDYDPTILFFEEYHTAEKNFVVSEDNSLFGMVDSSYNPGYANVENQWKYWKSGTSHEAKAWADILLNYITKSGQADGDTVTWYIPFQYDLSSSDKIVIKDYWPHGLDLANAKASLLYGSVYNDNGQYADTGTQVHELSIEAGEESTDYTTVSIAVPSTAIIGNFEDPATKTEYSEYRSSYHYIKIEAPVEDYEKLINTTYFTNYAQISVNGNLYQPVMASVSVAPPAKITKTHSYDKNTAPDASYEIVVNPYRFHLNNGGSLSVVDEMNVNLLYKEGSLKVEKIGTAESTDDVTGSVTVSYTEGTDNNVLTIGNLADETCYKITYTTLVNGVLGNKVQYKNTATLMAGETKVAQAIDNLNTEIYPPVGVAQGRAPTYINVKKTDASTGEPLAGAEFKLYTGYGTDDEACADSDTLTTNEHGEFDQNWSPEKNKAYTLVETKAPDGYKLNDNPVVATFGYFDKNGTAPSGCANLTNLLTVYTVTNEAAEQNGTLSISKTVTASAGVTAPDKEFTFAVELKNGDEALDTITTYKVGDEVTQITDGKITLKAGETAIIDGIPAGSTYTVTETDIPVGFAIAETEKSKTSTLEAGKTSEVTFTNTYTVADLTITKIVVGTDAPETDEFTFTVELKDGENPLTGLTYKVGEGEAVELSENGKISLTKGQTVTVTGIPVGATYTITETAHADYTTKVGETEGTVATGTIGEATNAVTFTNTYKYGSLKINKSFNGCTPAHGETFVFDVKDDSGIVVTQVVMTGAETVTVHKLEVGKTYTVSENNAWTWRYTADQASKSATISASEQAGVSFTNTRSNSQWLDDSAYADNNFDGSLPKGEID